MARTTKKKTAKKSRRTAVAAKKRKTMKKQSAPSFTATMAKEITATILDGVGAKLAAALAAENVNILAGTGYSASGFRRMATFTFIVDDLVKAEKALDEVGCENIQDQPIIMVETENRPGALERVARIIADAGIAIYYFYATTSSGKTATCVIKTANDKKAIKVLNRA
jgi:hypothetical protein